MDETIHYPNEIRSHLVTIAPMAPFTPKLTSRLRSALHFRYSIVIPRFISCANRAQSIFVDMCGVEGKRRLCDLNEFEPSSRHKTYTLCAVGQ